MRTLFVATMAGLATLIGFVGSASASATVDLLWGGTTATLSGVASSSSVTLDIVLTAGANGVNGYSLTITYDPTKVSATAFANTAPAGNFGFTPGGAPIDDGTHVGSFNGLAIIGLGTGLSAGNSVTIGTATFHKLTQAGTFEFTIGKVFGVDGIADNTAAHNDITGTSTYNSAFLVNAAVPEPGTVSLLAMGLGGLAFAGRRRR